MDILLLQGGTLNEESKTVNFKIDSKDTVSSVMLGSQGGQAIVDYVENLIKSHNTGGSGKSICFVYCSGGQDGQPSELFAKVNELITKEKSAGRFPHDLVILPLGIQNAMSIAENYARNDMTIMRTGGLASFEALECAKENQQNKFLIHSEGKGNDTDALREAIPVWEGGNARYLESSIQAKIVTPTTFGEVYSEVRKVNTQKLSM